MLRPRAPCTGAALLRPPVCASCRRGKPPGYPGQSPPARARADYFFKDHQGRCAPAPPVRAQRCCAPPYAPRAVGVNPPAIQGKARLRGRERIISSKTIRDAAPPRPLYGRSAAAPPPYAPRAVGVNPPAIQGKARLRGRERNNDSKTISPRLCEAKPAGAGYYLFKDHNSASGFAFQCAFAPRPPPPFSHIERRGR
jgi:hypothetical protein